jgi:hypothetical protein
MCCAPGLIFGGTEGVRSRFHIFSLPDKFLGVPRASGPFFMFCAPGLVFGGTMGVGSRLNILRARTHFRWYRGRRVPFSCFTLPNSFSAVPRASGLVFMFCPPRLFFGGTEGVRSRFHVFRSWTCFRLYRGRGVPFSCLTLPDSFSAVPRASSLVFLFALPYPFSVVPRASGPVFKFSAVPSASGPVFIFCALVLVFGGTEGVSSRFHFLRSRTLFRRYRRRPIPFSCFSLPDSFSAVPRASGPFFTFGAPGLVFGGTAGVVSRLHVLRSRTHFRQYRGRRVPFSCFARPDSFSAVPRVSGPVFFFCAPGLI